MSMRKFFTVLLGLSMALGTITLSMAQDQGPGQGTQDGTQKKKHRKGKRGKRGAKGKRNRNPNGNGGQSTPATPAPATPPPGN